MARGEELTDEQWAVIEPHLPELLRREGGRGRPWRENREVMSGILSILRSGARWQDLPGRFPPYQTCHRRFQQWVKDGTLRRVLEALAEGLRARRPRPDGVLHRRHLRRGEKRGAAGWCD
jgi:transposase